MKPTPIPIITLTTYQRIAAAGFDLELKQHPRTYLVHLVKGDQIVASGHGRRNCSIATADALAKAKNGRWGSASSMGMLLELLAAEAESRSNNKNV